MIRSFYNKGTEDVFDGTESKVARKTCPPNLGRVARRKLDMLNAATELRQLRLPPNNKLEKLKDDRLGQHSIHINDQYRICFEWTEQGPQRVEIADYH